jgi:hypothetical protein
VTKIALVADEHDDNVAIGVVAQLLEPAEDVDVGGMLGNIVDEQSSYSAAVVAVEMGRVSRCFVRWERTEIKLRRGDGAVTLLSSGCWG